MAKNAFSEDIDATRKNMTAFAPKDIVVDWTRNTSRACLYTWKGKPCCFRLEDVEDLTLPVAILARIRAGEDAAELIAEHAGPISLLSYGQETPITVYYDGKKRPVLVSGNRRVFAFMVLEEYGLLEHVKVTHGKSGQGKIDAVAIEQPKDPEGWLRVATANLAENSKKNASPIDVAWALRRLALPAEDGGEFGLGHVGAGQRVAALLGTSLTKRSVDRYLQLLTIPMDIQGKVHRAELSMAQALKVASDEGHGRARGERAGIKHSDLRNIPKGALEKLSSHRKPGDGRVFSAAEVEDMLLWVAGVEGVKPPSWGPDLLSEAEAAARAAKESGRKKKAPTNSKKKGKAA